MIKVTKKNSIIFLIIIAIIISANHFILAEPAKPTIPPGKAPQKTKVASKQINNKTQQAKSTQINKTTAKNSQTKTNITNNKSTIRKFIPLPKEVRGVWISYINWEKMPSEKKAFQQEVSKLLDRCVELHLNTVFVHVRSHSDAMYPSMYYPWSKFITGTQGKNPGYDPLKIFIESAHARGLSFHAWINPFRVTGYLNPWNQVAKNNPAKKWKNDSQKNNDRWVLKHNGEYYLNPSIPEVRKLIINGVNEVICNYHVDGIHFDDYFYPQIDDSDPKLSFDKQEYKLSKSKMKIEDWRRNNVNLLIKEVYKTVKKAKPSSYFGISPEGYLTKLRSNNYMFIDIDSWFLKPGYADYIIPQIYWGFETKTSTGQQAPYAFNQALKDWLELKKKSRVKLFLGLALYKTGRNTPDNNNVSEWFRHNDIMKRQIESGRRTGLVSGYVFYDYNSFQNELCKHEVKNIVSLFK